MSETGRKEMFVESAWKSWALFVLCCVAGSALLTLFVRGVWGADSPWWYFVIAGGSLGTCLSCIWIKVGWW